MIKNADKLRTQIVPALEDEREALRAEADSLTIDETRGKFTEADEARVKEIVARNEAIKAEIADALQLADKLDALEVERNAAPNFIRKPDPVTTADARNLGRPEARDAAMRIVDEARHASDGQRASVEKLLNRGRNADFDSDVVARQVIATEAPAYRDAFMKGIGGRADELTERERHALSEVRAMSTTTTAGGFAIPSLIDPTLYLTDGTGLLGILPYCDIKPITTGTWKGVSAGHTAWSFDAEAAEVSDDASTFAQPSVTAHRAQALIPFSIEIEQDYPGFAADMGVLLTDGYQDLLAEKLAVGTGSTQPWGIFQTTTTTVDVTTDNTFGAADIDKVWAALPERFRARATWFMNVDVENDIRGFGSGTATSRFTVDQTREGISLLNGRPVVLSDWAPTWTGTDAASILVLGDFSKFVVAQRIGMTVELVPHLTSTGSNRPNGTRGLYAYARVGSDKVVLDAFRKLKNITT